MNLRDFLPRARRRVKPNRVAIIRLYGPINGGERSADWIELVRRVRESKKVPAVVLDIDSPGGSAAASDNMYVALARLAAKKPLVAVDPGRGSVRLVPRGRGGQEDRCQSNLDRRLNRRDQRRAASAAPPGSLGRDCLGAHRGQPQGHGCAMARGIRARGRRRSSSSSTRSTTRSLIELRPHGTCLRSASASSPQARCGWAARLWSWAWWTDRRHRGRGRNRCPARRCPGQGHAGPSAAAVLRACRRAFRDAHGADGGRRDGGAPLEPHQALGRCERPRRWPQIRRSTTWLKTISAIGISRAEAKPRNTLVLHGHVWSCSMTCCSERAAASRSLI